MRARVVDQDAPHEPRGDGEKVGAILPLYLIDPRQTQIRLMHQRGRVEGVAFVLAAELAVREAVQLVVHDGHETIERLGPACGQLVQELGDVRSLGHVAPLPRPNYDIYA